MPYPALTARCLGASYAVTCFPNAQARVRTSRCRRRADFAEAMRYGAGRVRFRLVSTFRAVDPCVRTAESVLCVSGLAVARWAGGV